MINQEFDKENATGPDQGNGSGEEIKRDFQGLMGNVRIFVRIRTRKLLKRPLLLIFPLKAIPHGSLSVPFLLLLLV